MKKRSRSINYKIALILVTLVVLFVVVGIFFTPYDPNAMNGQAKNMAPNLAHWFGTDNYGRDILSRVMEGARTTFIIAVITVLVGGGIGTIVGAITGYVGGGIDEILMRINDGIAAFPKVLLALILISVVGTGKYNIIVALSVVFIPSFARIMRSEYATQKNMDYVKNARIMGATHFRIMFLHIFPNTIPVLLSSILIGFNNAILAEAGMSYLGLGVQPPDASLGRMLSEAQTYLLSAPWYAIFPGVMIIITVLGFSLLGDELVHER